MSREAVLSRECVLDFVELVLCGLPTPEDRVGWMQTHLPQTFGLLGLSRDWTALSVVPTNGTGALPRRRAAPPAPPRARRSGRYQPKTCTDCGVAFVPTQGGQLRCTGCRAAREYRPTHRRAG